MLITAETKYAEIAALDEFITPESVSQLKAAAIKQYGDPWELTIDNFFALTKSDYSMLGDMTDPTALQVYWCKAFADFAEELKKTLETLTVEQTPDQKRASAGTIEFDFQQSILVFCRSYFGLPSFAAVGGLTMGEFVLARKDKYNEMLTARNWHNMQERKFKKR